MRIKIFILLMIFNLISVLEICSESAIFIGNIYFKNDSGNKKVTSFLFGQKKRKRLTQVHYAESGKVGYALRILKTVP